MHTYSMYGVRTVPWSLAVLDTGGLGMASQERTNCPYRLPRTYLT